MLWTCSRAEWSDWVGTGTGGAMRRYAFRVWPRVPGCAALRRAWPLSHPLRPPFPQHQLTLLILPAPSPTVVSVVPPIRSFPQPSVCLSQSRCCVHRLSRPPPLVQPEKQPPHPLERLSLRLPPFRSRRTRSRSLQGPSNGTLLKDDRSPLTRLLL